MKYIPMLIATLLVLCGCSDEEKARVLAGCRVKAVDAVGPKPSPCLNDEDDPDYAACIRNSADKITVWEYQYSPYVDDCMRVAGYQMRDDCSRLGFSSGLRQRTDCYE
jgi:hypothetical protein